MTKFAIYAPWDHFGNKMRAMSVYYNRQGNLVIWGTRKNAQATTFATKEEAKEIAKELKHGYPSRLRYIEIREVDFDGIPFNSEVEEKEEPKKFVIKFEDATLITANVFVKLVGTKYEEKIIRVFNNKDDAEKALAKIKVKHPTARIEAI